MAGKNNIQDKNGRDRISKVLWFIYLFFLIVSVVVLVRIVQIKLFYEPAPEIAEYFRPKSVKSKLEPERGSIYAHDGRLIAMSTPMYQVYMDCTVMKEANAKDKEGNKERIWREKAKELGKGLAEIFPEKSASGHYDHIIQGREKGRKYLRIGHQIGHDTLQLIKALPLFNEGAYRGGIIVEKFDTRQYPYGSLARSAIGYVKNNADRPDGTRRRGIEGRYDNELHGKEGHEWMKVTDGREYIHNYDSSYVKAVDGSDIRTTLDIDIQDIADRALRTQIKDNPKIESGCIVVMDVKTGAIRAMVNLLRDSTGHLGEVYNYAVGRTGEPGSVFKATTLMSLLDDGKVKLSDTIPTNHGRLKGFPVDNYITDHERKNKTDKISVLRGFEISSNYVFRKLAMDHYGSNPKRMIDKLYLYKLGENYEFDLDGFAAPTLPSPESKYWSNTDLGSVAIGYSVSETPLHIVTFYNAIANKGQMMKPYLVESIEKNGHVTDKRGPSVLNGSICSKATADSLSYALRQVVEEGTGRTRLKGARCAIAGKTGTSRMVLEPKERNGSKNPYEDTHGRKRYQATFVGFFPAEEPQYTAICVIYSKLDREAFYGGTLPAMAIREIVDNVYALNPGNGETISEKHPLPKWENETAK